jgi:hypothetical protein
MDGQLPAAANPMRNAAGIVSSMCPPFTISRGRIFA